MSIAELIAKWHQLPPIEWRLDSHLAASFLADLILPDRRGWFGVCAEIVRENERDDSAEAIIDAVPRWIEQMGAEVAAAQARLHLDCAREMRDSGAPGEWRNWDALAAKHGEPPGFVRDLAAKLCGSPKTPFAAAREPMGEASVIVLLANGEPTAPAAFTLRVELAAAGTGVIHPDPSMAMMPRADGFNKAIDRARDCLKTRGIPRAGCDLRWTLSPYQPRAFESKEGHALAFADEAIGAALAYAGSFLEPAKPEDLGEAAKRRDSLCAHLAISARIDERGAFQDAGEIDARIDAVPATDGVHLLIFPEASLQDLPGKYCDGRDPHYPNALHEYEDRVPVRTFLFAKNLDAALNDVAVERQAPHETLTDYSEMLKRVRAGTTVRRPWLNAELDHWRDGHPKGGLLLIEGKPGTGKTEWLAQQVTAMTPVRGGGSRQPEVAIYHFLKRRRDGKLDDPDSMYGSLTTQLLRKHRLLLSDEAKKESHAEKFLLVLGMLSKEGISETIWIDGLDETYSERGSFHGAALQELFRATDSSAPRLEIPPGIHLVVTSEGGKHLDELKRLPQGQTVNLDDAVQVSHAQADLRKFFAEQGQRLELSLTEKEINGALAACEGNFLCAVWVMEGFQSARASGIVPDIGGGLDGQMGQLVTRVIEKWKERRGIDAQMADRKIREFLGLLVFSREPLTIGMIRALFPAKRAEELIAFCTVAADTVNSFFATVPDTSDPEAPLRFFHRKLADFVATYAGHQRKRVHGTLAAACRRWRSLEGAARNYALRWLLAHLSGGEYWAGVLRLSQDLDYLRAALDAGATKEKPEARDGVFYLLRSLSLALDGDRQRKDPPIPTEDAGRRWLADLRVLLRAQGDALDREPERLLQQLHNHLPEEWNGTPLKSSLRAALEASAPPHAWIELKERTIAMPPGTRPLHVPVPRGKSILTAIFVPGLHGAQNVATAGTDRSINLSAVETGQNVRLGRHSGVVTGLALMHDGCRLVSVSLDGTVRLWQLDTLPEAGGGRDGEYVSIGSNLPPAHSVAASPVAPLIAVGFTDGSVLLWHLEDKDHEITKPITITPPEQIETEVQRHLCIRVVFSPNGRRLVVNRPDGKVSIYSVGDGPRPDCKLLRQLEPPTSRQVDSMAIAPDNRTLAIGGGYQRGAIELWDIESGKRLREAFHHSDSVWALAFTRCGKFLISGSFDRTFTIWDFRSLKPQIEMRNPEIVFALAVSPDDRWLVTVAADCLPAVWEMSELCKSKSTASSRDSARAHSHFINAAAFNTGGNRLVSGDQDGIAHLWDAGSGNHLAQLLAGGSPVRSVGFSADGSRIAIGTWMDARVMHREGDHGDRFSTEFTAPGPALATALSRGPRNRYFATGGQDGFVTVHDLSNTACEPLRKQLHRGIVRTLCFSLDDTNLVSAGDDGHVVLLNIPTGERLDLTERGDFHLGRAKSSALSVDGRFLATGGHHTIKIWDISTRALLKNLHGHTDEIWTLAFSACGRFLASGGKDMTARVWDTATGELLSAFPCHNAVLTVSFSATGLQLRVADAGPRAGVPTCFVTEFHPKPPQHHAAS